MRQFSSGLGALVSWRLGVCQQLSAVLGRLLLGLRWFVKFVTSARIGALQSFALCMNLTL